MAPKTKITRNHVPAMTKRIAAMRQAADAGQVAAGRAWYPAARELAAAAGHGDVRNGAGKIAALSLNTAWKENARKARQLAAGETVKHVPLAMGYLAALDTGADFADVLPAGKKIWCFAHNLAGDLSHVTVDRWAVRIATGSMSCMGKLTPAQYECVAEAYRRAAAKFGEPPAETQAITWVVARGTGE